MARQKVNNNRTVLKITRENRVNLFLWRKKKGLKKKWFIPKIYETVLRKREDPIEERRYAVHGVERNENEVLLRWFSLTIDCWPHDCLYRFLATWFEMPNPFCIYRSRSTAPSLPEISSSIPYPGRPTEHSLSLFFLRIRPVARLVIALSRINLQLLPKNTR